MNWAAIGVLGLEVLACAGILLALFRLRRDFGLTPLCAFLATLQPISVLMASWVYMQVAPGVLISPGSSVLFTAGIFALLLVYIREDALAVRRVVYSLVLANLATLLIFQALDWQLPGLTVESRQQIQNFGWSNRVMAAGTLMLLVDVLLVMPAYEAFGRILPASTYLRCFLAMALVLLVDSLGFALLGFSGTPMFEAVLFAGAVGKLGATLVFALVLGLYLQQVEPLLQKAAAPAAGYGGSLRGVFNALSYRQRFELQEAVVEDALRAATVLQSEMLQVGNDALLALDARWCLVDCNAQAEILFARPRQELLGTALVDLIQADGLRPLLASAGAVGPAAGFAGGIAAGFAGGIAAAATGDGPAFGQQLEGTVAVDDGQARQIVVRVTRLSQGVGAVAAMAAVLDVSGRNREFAQQLQAGRMDSIARLAGGIAHDFNNLLTVIMSGATLLELTAEHHTQNKNQAVLIREAAERGARLTSQLLAFARREMLPPSVVDLNSVVRGLEDLLLRMLGQRVELVLDLAADVHPVWISPDQLEQLLLNLVSNACDAMPDGGQLTIRTGNSQTGDGVGVLAQRQYAWLEIIDQGEGIAQADVERIFEPFFTTKAEGEGTGLGLSMCLGIAELAGGTIRVERGADRGSCFRVSLPRTRRSLTDAAEGAQAAFAQELELAGVAEAASSRRILVVDDDVSVAEVVRLMLESVGYQVQVVHSGDQALQLLADGQPPPDLLLTDLVMPGIRGDQLVAQVRAKGFIMPVIYMTGHATGVALDMGSLGGHRLLHKPFSATVLFGAVSAELDAASQPAAAQLAGDVGQLGVASD